jgi:subtilisin family serine protease
VKLLKSTNRNVAELLREYSGRPDVLYAEPNYIWRKNDLPNDPYFDGQWFLRNTGQTIQGFTGIVGADIRATQAWDISQGSRSVVIGIVDSGIDYNHPDIAANVWSAPRDFTVVVGDQSITCRQAPTASTPLRGHVIRWTTKRTGMGLLLPGLSEAMATMVSV